MSKSQLSMHFENPWKQNINRKIAKCLCRRYLTIVREWASGKLVKYESLRVSNGRVESGRVGSKMVKLRVDMRVYTEKISIFQCQIPCDY